MRVFHKDYIQQQTHKVMLCDQNKILVGDITQTEWDYFITLPFASHYHGKTKKEYEEILRGFRYNLLSKLATSGEIKNGARLETFSVVHHLTTNAHFHFAIKVPNHWKRVAAAHDKDFMVKSLVEKVMVHQKRLVSQQFWDAQHQEIIKPVSDPMGVFSYCVSESGSLDDIIDKTNLYIERKVA